MKLILQILLALICFVYLLGGEFFQQEYQLELKPFWRNWKFIFMSNLCLYPYDQLSSYGILTAFYWSYNIQEVSIPKKMKQKFYHFPSCFVTIGAKTDNF